MNDSFKASNMHIPMKYPFKIPQSQPKEGDRSYLQSNFPQGQLTLNASINDPKVRVLTPPWRMHRPDEPCPYYAPNGEFEEVRGKVETGYKLDYGRTNHEINRKVNANKNRWSRIRQMKPNEYVDITDPDLATVEIRDDSINEWAYRSTDDQPDVNQSNANQGKESFQRPLGLYSNNVERFNTPRYANRTAGSLNDYGFHAPNDRSYNDHNRPILPMKGDQPSIDSSSKYVPINELHKYTDAITIRDESLTETDWANESNKDRFCPLKAAIKAKKEAAERSWKMMTEDETVNREAFRRNIHRKCDDGSISRDDRRPISGSSVGSSSINGLSIEGFARSGDVRSGLDSGFYFKGKPISLKDRFADQKLYEKYTGKARREAFESATNGDRRTPPREGFQCQCQPYLDSMYKHILEARASAIVLYLLKDQSFRPWIKQWEFLQRNINKCNMDFNQLEDDHEDVAYSLDKGKELSFRFRDKDKYMPLSVESYVLAHEMAHVANEEVGHGEKFQELMHLIEVAAYMLQFIDLSKYSDSTVHSNGQEILSRRSIKHELFDGIDNLIAHSEDPEQREYWEQIRKRVENNK